MKNKIIGIAMAVVAVATLAGCGGDSGGSKSPAPSTSAPAASNAPAGGDTSASPATSPAGGDASTAPEGGSGGGSLEAAIAETPILLTSVGQSADVEMVKTMLDRAELSPTINKMATSADLGDAKTLVLAIGGSSKGLGAAGIDADQELERVKELISAADEKGLTIIATHVGGEARRGELSDKFIGPSFEKADYAIIVAEGDKDGMMAGLAKDNNIPIDVVNSMAEVVEPLKAAFK